jgi:hypothetical protein
MIQNVLYSPIDRGISTAAFLIGGVPWIPQTTEYQTMLDPGDLGFVAA